jgi:hypothetical protein
VGTRGSFPAVTRPGYEDNHSPTSSVEVKNVRRYTYAPLYVLVVLCLIDHKDSLAFLHLLNATDVVFIQNISIRESS